MISAPSDDGIVAFEVSTFTGGITDTGTISASAIAIAVDLAGNFADGITIGSAGKVAASSGSAITIENIATFAGDIGNAGTVSGRAFGIYDFGGSTFAGGIDNSGSISASRALAFS